MSAAPAGPHRRSTFMRGSIAAHVLAAAGLIWKPTAWPYIAAGLFGNHLLGLGASFWPRSRLLGPNMTRLPSGSKDAGTVALTFDDGPDPEVTPRVLDMLESKRARATFFCIGRKAEEHQKLTRTIREAGHRVENHTYSHPKMFCVMSPGSIARELDRAQTILTECTGEAPRYFRAPAGLRNPWTFSMLDARGLVLVSWTRRGYDTVIRDPSRIEARLTRGLDGGDVLLLHDGSSATSSSGQPVILEVLPGLLESLDRHGLRAIAMPEPKAAARAH